MTPAPARSRLGLEPGHPWPLPESPRVSQVPPQGLSPARPCGRPASPLGSQPRPSAGERAVCPLPGRADPGAPRGWRRRRAAAAAAADAGALRRPQRPGARPQLRALLPVRGLCGPGAAWRRCSRCALLAAAGLRGLVPCRRRGGEAGAAGAERPAERPGPWLPPGAGAAGLGPAPGVTLAAVAGSTWGPGSWCEGRRGWKEPSWSRSGCASPAASRRRC